MRNNDYFSKYDDRFSSGRQGMSGGGMRYGGGDSSFSQFRDRGEMFRDSYSRTNSGFGSGMGGGGGFSDLRSSGMGMQDYDMGYNDMRGRSDYSGRNARSPLIRGMKRNLSSGSGFGGRSPGGMGMGGNMSTTEALLSLGLQARNLLENRAAAYGPPAPKMRRLNTGYSRPMTHGRGVMRRGRGRGGASRGGSTRVQKPREVPEWRKTPYHCNFCHKATKTRENHAEHLKTKEHKSAVKDREQKLVDRMYTLHKRAQANAEQARMQGQGHLVRFCGICGLEYIGKIVMHKKSKDHLAMTFLLHVKCNDCDLTIPNRIQYERHNATQLHIRNHMYNKMEAIELDEADEELECPEEYDENVGVGNMYINDRRAVYCKVCDKLFTRKDVKVFDHCKSKEHFDNFKDFVVTRKAELEEKATEKAKKAEEAAAAKEAADTKEEGKAEEEAEDEEKDDEEEAADEEAAEGEAEEVDEDQALDGENGNEDVEMEEEVEEKEAPAKSSKKSPAVKARTTPKRNAKTK